MKAWTDEECDALISATSSGDLFRILVIRNVTRTIIRAAVDEARREEREACAKAVRKVAGMASAFEDGILARDKKPRDAER